MMNFIHLVWKRYSQFSKNRNKRLYEKVRYTPGIELFGSIELLDDYGLYIGNHMVGLMRKKLVEDMSKILTEIPNETPLEIFESLDHCYPDKIFHLIKCGDYFIGFNPHINPYESQYRLPSLVQIFHKDEIKVNTFTSLTDDSSYELFGCPKYLDELTKQRINVLLGLPYSFYIANSSMVAYYISKGKKFTVLPDLDGFAIANSILISILRNEKSRVFDEIKYYFLNDFFLSELNSWFEKELQFDSEERERSLTILNSIEDATEMTLVKRVNRDFSFDQFISSTFTLNTTRKELVDQLIEDRKFRKHLKSISGPEYENWFIKVANHTILFNFDLYDYLYYWPSKRKNQVKIVENTNDMNNMNNCQVVENIRLTSEIRSRIKKVMGMRNYSLLLRNSEHVMNYIASGRWISYQTEENGRIYSEFFKIEIPKSIDQACFLHFINKNKEKFKKLINTFPSSIKSCAYASDFVGSIYSFIDESKLNLLTPTDMQYYLDHNEQSCNVLFIGQMGSGKSRMVNMLLNKKVVESQASFESVTKDIYFIKSKFNQTYNDETKTLDIDNKDKEIVLTDMIGLCDSGWDKDKLIDFIKGRVSRNFHSVDIVFILITCDRLNGDVPENIDPILKWLKYIEFKERFVFVITKSGDLEEDEKKRLKIQIEQKLKLGDVGQNLIFSAFPNVKENELSNRQRNLIQTSLASINKMLVKKRICQKIPINFEEIKQETKSSSSCTIL